MQSIIHHMHSGSGDSSDEHGCETHFIKTGVAVLDRSYGVGVVQIFEVQAAGRFGFWFVGISMLSCGGLVMKSPFF